MTSSLLYHLTAFLGDILRLTQRSYVKTRNENCRYRTHRNEEFYSRIFVFHEQNNAVFFPVFRCVTPTLRGLA